MKRLLKTALMTMVFAVLLCASALAANGEAGIYALTFIDGVEVEAQLENGTPVTPAPATLTNVGGVNDYCENAVKVAVTYSGAKTGEEYLLFAVNDGNNIPTSSNIAYIDQQSGKATFTVYPILEDGKTYTVYLVSNGTFEKKPVASFTYHYYVPYMLGDVDLNGGLSANDALMALQLVAHKGEFTDTQKVVADADQNGGFSGNDALYILQAVAHLRTLEFK